MEKTFDDAFINIVMKLTISTKEKAIRFLTGLDDNNFEIIRKGTQSNYRFKINAYIITEDSVDFSHVAGYYDTEEEVLKAKNDLPVGPTIYSSYTYEIVDRQTLKNA